ncbi:UDP-N-acetylmuramoyl-L-alanyl-D-glutamate--2,6-diaminopimelate ligase [Candidatus Cyanaurora vandensis]|uniref:UDP-N-acetylmuramoyl-L-alanyl-D-glutamate--2, 6-diaminopimelate ligase n=1 Tax=Candidatus Cyanaurora vandensis TaxID=2714958 RepID=UPI00257A333E|nr:UDP-N-acetylmuramoyl-L-alanyl-D-glutamate--2,6-diaminopimelate ligase [Candidatus Cyanaurora vandensis]
MYLDELLTRAGLTDHPHHHIALTGLETDSREVQPGDLFIGLPGSQVDGGAYWPQAAARGACAAIVSEQLIIPADPAIPLLAVADPSRVCARLAAAYYNFPARQMELVAVTGTNGKTTTTHLIEHFLQPTAGLVGTLYARWPGHSTTALHTTPFALDIQRTLAQILAAGCPRAVLEVSSHALSQGRVQECVFQAAVFTNLTQDHLDFHPDLEAYFQAKAQLFSSESLAGRAILNQDDPYGQRLLASCPESWSYGLTPDADIHATEVVFGEQGIQGRLVTPHGQTSFQAPLVGQFNLYNFLGAVGAALHLGVPLAQIVTSLATFPGVPGRVERVSAPDQDITVVVDYAHTPDGLENLLMAIRPFVRGRLIAVFGCGGDRDRTKRPLMGAIVARLADVAVVTSDNPRTEDPERILQDVVAGMDPLPTVVEVDRRRAIAQAIALARPGDGVVIAGKGHEDYQILGHEKFPFDDRVEARRALAQRGPVR